jgi:hypothetical protein
MSNRPSALNQPLPRQKDHIAKCASATEYQPRQSPTTNEGGPP